MTTLRHFRHDGSALGDAATGSAALARLQHLGIETGRWALQAQPVSSTPQLTYARELQALQRRFGAVLTDRVRWPLGRTPAAPRAAEPEPADIHLHHDLEARVVLAGRAHFVIATGVAGGWATVDCEAGDWIVLPEGLPHALQPGASLDLLRLFTRPRGWVAHATDIGRPPALSSSAPLRLAA